MRRALICFAASSCLLAGGLTLPAEAATSVPTNGVTIPRPGQGTATFDTSVCPWQIAYDSMTPAAAASYAPLVAALCGMFGV